MLTITVNVCFDLLEYSEKIEKALEKGMADLTVATHGNWKALAHKRLHSRREKYEEALTYESHGLEGKVTLASKDRSLNWLFMALELGHKPFDLKPGRVTMGRQGLSVYAFKYKTTGEVKKNPPFIDIRMKKQIKGSYFARMTPQSKGWQHPGFKPIGSGGPGPIRPDVVTNMEKEIQKIFKEHLDRVL